MECTYAIEGDLFTETSYVWESPKPWPPVTYRWQFDGELLTFEPYRLGPVLRAHWARRRAGNGHERRLYI